MNKLKISLIASSVLIVGGLGSAVLWNGVANGEWDLPGLQQQVQHVTEVTDNHEGRITNLENKANTPSDQPTPTPVVVTKVVTEAAPAVVSSAPVVAGTASTSAATPVPTVTSVEHVVCVAQPQNIQAVVTHYSDGNETILTADGQSLNGPCQEVNSGNKPASW